MPQNTLPALSLSPMISQPPLGLPQMQAASGEHSGLGTGWGKGESSISQEGS